MAAGGPTRKTHIVRITQDPPSDSYIDVEVLDAIAFRGEGGKEMILNMDGSKAVPYIKDDTGGGHEKEPGKPTRLSHMQRVTNSADNTQKLDIEVIDVVAFRDTNGTEWILDMKATTGEGPDLFDTTDNTGTRQATRRVHQEKIAPKFGDKNPTQYLTIKRCDAMTFRTVMGREMVVKCPSSDDPNSSDPRANTVTTPAGYNPANDDGPKPPENKDPNQYIAFVKNAGGFLTGKEEIMQGPLWWIRKISTGGAYILVTINATNKSRTAPPPFPTDEVVIDPKNGVKLLDSKEEHHSTNIPPVSDPQIIYFVWNDIAPPPTVDNWSNVVVGNFGGSADGALYAEQFARNVFIVGQGSTAPPPPGDGGGIFKSFDDAAAYAAVFNAQYSSSGVHNFEGYRTSDGTVIDFAGPGAVAEVSARTLYIPSTSKPFYQSTTVFTYLYSIPTKEAFEMFTPFVTAFLSADETGSSTMSVLGYSDVKKQIKVLADLQDITLQPDDPDPDNRQDFASLNNSGTYTVTQSVVAGLDPTVKPHRVKIVVTGGDSDDPPPPTNG